MAREAKLRVKYEKDKLGFQASAPKTLPQLHIQDLEAHSLPFRSLSDPCKFLFCSKESRATHRRYRHTPVYCRAVSFLRSEWWNQSSNHGGMTEYALET